MSKLQEKPSVLKREHQALRLMKFLKFFYIFVGHFCLPGSESGSTTLAVRKHFNFVHS
jgi:hypothetical protein